MMPNFLSGMSTAVASVLGNDLWQHLDGGCSRMKPRFPHVCWLIVLVLSLHLRAHAAPTTNQAEDRFFNSNGVRIRYFIVGQGEPVVLVHGWGGSAEMWTPLIKELSPNYRLIAMDCRGHGKSDKPHDASQYGIEMVNDIVRLLDHLKINKAHIIGYSMGGMIVMKMLIEHPDRFRTAVVGASQGHRSSDEAWDGPLIKALQSGMSLSEAMIATAPPGTPPPSPEQRESMRRMDATHDPKALAAQRLGNDGLIITYEPLKTNKVPTLMICGSNDHPERFTDLKKVLANGEFKVVEGASHGNAFSNPQFSKDIHEFLEKHLGATNH